MSNYTDKQITDFQGSATTIFTLNDPSPVEIAFVGSGAIIAFAVLVWAFQRWNLTRKINKVIAKIND